MLLGVGNLRGAAYLSWSTVNTLTLTLTLTLTAMNTLMNYCATCMLLVAWLNFYYAKISYKKRCCLLEVVQHRAEFLRVTHATLSYNQNGKHSLELLQHRAELLFMSNAYNTTLT